MQKTVQIKKKSETKPVIEYQVFINNCFHAHTNNPEGLIHKLSKEGREFILHHWGEDGCYYAYTKQ